MDAIFIINIPHGGSVTLIANILAALAIVLLIYMQ